MAVAIPLKLLDREQQDLVFKHLRIKPKVSWFVAQKQRNYGNKDTDPPVQFYVIEGEEILVPFLFSKCLKLSIAVSPELAANVDTPGQIYNMGSETRMYLSSDKMGRPNSKVNYIKTDLTFTGTLRPYQIPIAQQALEHLDSVGTAILGLPPGFGKTILGCYLACIKKMMVAILVHRKILPGQWKNTFEKTSNAKVLIAGEKFKPGFQPNVVIFMDSQVKKFDREYRKNFGILIIDECHCFCTRSKVEPLLGFEPSYVILESATLKRQDEMEKMMYSIAGTNELKIISQRKFSLYKVETGITVNLDNDSDWNALKKAVFYNDAANKIIYDLVLCNLDRKILIITIEVNHVLLLYENLKKISQERLQSGLSKPFTVDYMCSTKRTYSDSNVLIGSLSKIGIAFDEQSFCPNYNGNPINLVIVCGSIKQESTLDQCLGRGFRSDFPVFFDIVHDHPIFKRHYQRRQKWYREHNGTIQVLRMTPPDQNNSSNANSGGSESDSEIESNCSIDDGPDELDEIGGETESTSTSVVTKQLTEEELLRKFDLLEYEDDE